MFRGPYQFQMHGMVRAFENADSAAHAVFINDISLHFLRTRDFAHFDAVKDAAFDTGLAALTFRFIDHRPEAAGG